MLKKVLHTCVVAIVLVTMTLSFSMNIMAINEAAPTASTTLSVTSAVSLVGQTAIIDLNITPNSSMGGGVINISYDKNKLVYYGFTAGKALTMDVWRVIPNQAEGKVTISCVSSNKAYTDGGKLLSIELRAKSGIAAGEIPVNVTVAEMLKYNFATIVPALSNGNITAVKPFDIDIDNIVTIKDPLMSLKFACGILNPSEANRLAGTGINNGTFNVDAVKKCLNGAIGG